MALLVRGAALKRLPLAYGWYYRAAVMAGSGDFKGAAAAIETAPKIAAGSARALSPAEGLAGSFALGALYAAMGDPVKSAAAFSRAAAAAPDGHGRCAALEGLGRALGDTGDRRGRRRPSRPRPKPIRPIPRPRCWRAALHPGKPDYRRQIIDATQE